MSRLGDISRKNNNRKKGKEQARRGEINTAIPSYGIDGKVINPGKAKRKKNLLIFLTIIIAIALFIYIPQYFMNEPEEEMVVLQPDASAVALSSNLLRDNGNEDFDDDGVINSDETAAGISAWNADTDGDGLSDYYEIHVSGTNPAVYENNLVDIQRNDDINNDRSLSTGYMIGNVILWADDYNSKAYGSVVETLHGYHFCNFNGYAEFPDAGNNCYVYKVENGIRSLLPSRYVNSDTGEIAWKVSAGDIVEIYTEPLTEVIEMTLFNNTFYLEPNAVTSFLANVLPDKGFITMTTKMTIDVTPDGQMDTVVDIQLPSYEIEDATRFAVNSNTLADLQTVYNTIDAGGCVATSLFNEKYGEYVYLAYGYDYDGNLLMADSNTLEPVGKLNVMPSAKKMVNDVGNIVSVSYFEYSGFGFDSQNNDRICFFAEKGASSNLINSITEDVNIDSSDDSNDEDSIKLESDDEISGNSSSEATNDNSESDSVDRTEENNTTNTSSNSSSSENTEEEPTESRTTPTPTPTLSITPTTSPTPTSSPRETNSES